MKIFRSILAAFFLVAALSILFDFNGSLLDNFGGFIIGLLISFFLIPKEYRVIMLEKIGLNKSRLTHLDKVKKELEISQTEKNSLQDEIKDLELTRSRISNEVAGVKKITLDEELQRIDKLDGHTFENYCGRLLEKIGFENVNITVGSGDQGLDILASMGSTSYGFQCKNYSSTVGNKSVQEALAGKVFYRVDRVGVITNNYFTASAKKLALEGNVELWDRDTLREILEDEMNSKQNIEAVTTDDSTSSEWCDF